MPPVPVRSQGGSALHPFGIREFVPAGLEPREADEQADGQPEETRSRVVEEEANESRAFHFDLNTLRVVLILEERDEQHREGQPERDGDDLSDRPVDTRARGSRAGTTEPRQRSRSELPTFVEWTSLTSIVEASLSSQYPTEEAVGDVDQHEATSRHPERVERPLILEAESTVLRVGNEVTETEGRTRQDNATLETDERPSDDGRRGRARNAADLLDAVDAATRAVASVLSVDEVLQVIVDQVRPLVGAHTRRSASSTRRVIERFITRDRPRDPGADRDLPRGHGLLGLIIQESRSFRIPDIAVDRGARLPAAPPADAQLPRRPGRRQGPIGRQPLPDQQERAAEFSEGRGLVETFARHAGIAIENARLHEQVQRLAIVDERERISKDLHDGIIQSIYAVGLSLEDVPELMPRTRTRSCGGSSAPSTAST